MDEVLGTTAGNALEVRESIDYLTGAAREPRLHEVTLALAAAAARAGRPARRRGRRARRRAGRARLRRRRGALRRAWSPRSAAPPTCSSSPASTSPPRRCTAPVAPERARRRDRHGLPRRRPGRHRPRRQPRDARTTGSTPPSGSREIAPDRRRGRPGPPAGGRARARRGGRRRGRGGAARGGHASATSRPPPRPVRGRDAYRRDPQGRAARAPGGHGAAGAVRRLAAAQRDHACPTACSRTRTRFRWVDFLDFLATYDLAASVIRTAEDYRDVTYEYLVACAAEGASTSS